ncbi:hypothetical protein [Brevundimonas sp. NIBR11]|uniref:hypothetical protein n=1 Tax=Brevundimonas sp. NIBR11 TaxID=3015999 RepID=UPI0022F09318|nr:hypothetical protein [Brevundimonas sp. NIBR11]WGM30006.1 hypothetical protein KKHFBJBL_00221 [Brevundimonas sp. NIBR11]
MTDAAPTRRKIRPEAVWAEARKAWEDGETARSVAKRYDVGVPALWKRREAEGWKRPDPVYGPVEPAEGWSGFAARAWGDFERKLFEEQRLARGLAASMMGDRPGEVSQWHIPFVMAWRAEHLGAEVAAADRERYRDEDWAGAVWDAEGNMGSVPMMTLKLARLFAADWRKEHGLPEGVAEGWP